MNGNGSELIGLDGTRTHTSLRTGDFKSPASAIPPRGPESLGRLFPVALRARGLHQYMSDLAISKFASDWSGLVLVPGIASARLPAGARMA